MRLRHILIATTAFVSLGALAEGNRAAPDKQPQAGASASVQSHANSSVIKQVQQKLSAAGHDGGPADGILGAKTQQALKDREADQVFPLLVDHVAPMSKNPT